MVESKAYCFGYLAIKTIENVLMIFNISKYVKTQEINEYIFWCNISHTSLQFYFFKNIDCDLILINGLGTVE